MQTQGRPGPAFGDHTRNLEGSPGRVGTGPHLVTPGVAREPVAHSQSPGLSCAAGTPSPEGPGRRPEDAGGVRRGDPSLSNMEEGEQRRTGAPRNKPPQCPPGRRDALHRSPPSWWQLPDCLYRPPPLRPPPSGPGDSGPVPAGPPVRDAGGDPSTFPSAGWRVTQGSAPRTRPSTGQAVPTHLTSWSLAKGARRLPLGAGDRGNQETLSVSRSCRPASRGSLLA